MKYVDWKDVGIRAVKTFIQTFVSVFAQDLIGINLFDGGVDEVVWIGFALSAGSAAASAVWNGVISPVFKNYKPPENN